MKIQFDSNQQYQLDAIQAADAADRGEVVPWDPDRIRAEGRRRLADNTRRS